MKLFNHTNIDRAKNIVLAAFIFGSIGGYLGMHYTNQYQNNLAQASLHAAAKVAVPVAQASK